MAPRLLIACLLIVAAVAAGGFYMFAPGERSGPPLNVLLITLDTTRADRLGCYGYQRPTSPNLDKLAAEAARFDLAIAQAAVTPVSHASIFTGLDPYRHGLRVLHGVIENRLEADQVTLAEVWKQSGGETAAFISAFPAGSSFGLDQGFDSFDEDFPNSDGTGLKSEKGTVNTGASQRGAEKTSDAAIRWLESRSDEKSFFAWLHYFDPHDFEHLPPLQWANENISKFKRSESEPFHELQAMYDTEVLFMDEQIGRVFQTLRELELWENTIVVVVADHGEGLGDHDWWSHGILYQEQIRVPLIVRTPGVAKGAQIGALVRTTDLMPTILEVAGVDSNSWPAMDGESLTGLLQGTVETTQRQAYSDSVNMMIYARSDNKKDRKMDKLYCLMDGQYKLIYHQLEPENIEFYNLQTDPRELNNLATYDPPEMAEMLESLKNLAPFSEIVPGMSPTDLERLQKLKSIGYTK